MSQKKPDYFDAFNDGQSLESPEEKASEGSDEFARMLGESFSGRTEKKLKVGDRIRGKILVLGKEDVYVSTGTRHDGVVARRDLLDAEGNCPYKVDDTIELYVTVVRGTDIRLSKNATDRNLAEDLEDAFDKMMPIPGRIVEVCNGGVRVNIKGKLAFCPISQIDTQRVENAEDYVGKSFDFRITQFTEGGRNIVVSRRKLLEEERELGTVTFLEEHGNGDVVPGKVVRLEKFGAFVELAPGIDGLVHISEIAWSRIGDPSEVLQPGQVVNVKILKREIIEGRAKISLSMKQAAPKEDSPGAGTGAADSWAKFTVGQVLTGKINRKELYGLFVQLEPGVTGLLHKSRMQEHPEVAFEKLKVGDSVTVQIGEIRAAERQISLTVPRDPSEDEWRTHRQESTPSFGTLGDRMKAALAKKKA